MLEVALTAKTIPTARPGNFAYTFNRKLRAFAFQCREFYYQLLRIDAIRALVAGTRYFFLAVLLRRFRTLEDSKGSIGRNTIHHNSLRITSFKNLAVIRSNLLVYPLSVIRMSRNAPILSIGPRMEGEILNLMALGFHNVRALDLISYSSWVDLGDMHAMPYADNQFFAVIMGWVLSYSDDRAKAANEVLRVTRNGGIIAIGIEYSKETAEEASKRVGYEMCNEEKMTSTADILALFGHHVDHVYFSQNVPPGVSKGDMMVIFSVKK